MSERETMNPRRRSLALVLVAGLLLLGPEAPAQRVDRYGDPLPDQAIVRLGTVRFRGLRECLAFSPAGRLLAVAITQVQSQIGAHDGPVAGVAFSADGRQLTSWGGDGVLIWEVPGGRPVHRARIDDAPGENCLALVADGRRITLNPATRLCRLRDAESGRVVLHFDALAPIFFVVAPGGRFAAIPGRDGEIRVLDLRAGKCAYEVDPKGNVFQLMLSADGEVLVWLRNTGGALDVEVRHHTSGKALTIPGVPNRSETMNWRHLGTCLAPNGRRLVMPAGERRLRCWDLVTGQELPALTGLQRRIVGFHWSADGRFVGARGWENGPGVIDPGATRHMLWWDMDEGRRLSYFDAPDMPEAIQFAPDGRTLALTDDNGTIRLLETATGRERGILRGHLPGEVAALAFDSRGRLLASGGEDSQVFLWDLTGRMPDGVWRTAPLEATARRAAWDRLAGNDATVAHAAQWQLIADPQGTVTLLREQLRPLPRPDPRSVREWIALLGSDDFAERQRASRELRELGDRVAGDLAAAQKQNASAEARRRLEALQEALQAPPAGRQLQRMRAVEVLEQLGTPEARDLLRKLAEGEAGQVGREARRALERP